MDSKKVFFYTFSTINFKIIHQINSKNSTILFEKKKKKKKRQLQLKQNSSEFEEIQSKNKQYKSKENEEALESGKIEF